MKKKWKKKKRNERCPSWKGRSRTVTICRKHDFIHRKPHDTTKKVRTNTVKLQSTKSVYKYCCFLYTNNKEQEREIKKTSPFTITSKKIKYLGINLVKEVKTYNAKNYMTLMKEMKDIQINGNIVHAHELEELI